VGTNVDNRLPERPRPAGRPAWRRRPHANGRVAVVSGASEVVSEARSGDSYDAHSYHTKVPPRAIARLIATHAPYGGTVADAYCGSGTTGVAAALAEATTSSSYDVILGDLSPYATFIARALNSPPPEDDFEREASHFLAAARRELSEYWTTNHVDGRQGQIVYTIWSEVLLCPACGTPLRYWDVAVDHERGTIRREINCRCGVSFRKPAARRQLETYFDPVLQHEIERPVREPVLISYEVDGRRYRKKPDQADTDRLAALENARTPAACPRTPMLNREGPWGDLYRAGYHEGITHVHQFYTRRNLLSVGHLWDAATNSAVPQHLRFLVSSYNLAHSTLMSRVVFKRDSSMPVLTGYQTGTLYISSLPVEKNPLLGIERNKLGAVSRAFQLTRQRRGAVRVMTGPAAGWGEIPEQLDYVFVDPPFGANIPYAEANFIAEAWLGQFTDQASEAAMSKAQKKSADDYRAALTEGFEAIRSRLRTAGLMTVMFHSAESEPWRALTGALADAGFETDSVQLLDKRQASFKQVRSSTAVEGDVLIHVRARSRGVTLCAAADPVVPALDPRTWLADEMATLSEVPSVSDQRALFSRYAAGCVERGVAVAISAEQFYRLVRAISVPSSTRAATA
jgi:predicted RNA methylase